MGPIQAITHCPTGATSGCHTHSGRADRVPAAARPAAGGEHVPGPAHLQHRAAAEPEHRARHLRRPAPGQRAGTRTRRRVCSPVARHAPYLRRHHDARGIPLRRGPGPRPADPVDLARARRAKRLLLVPHRPSRNCSPRPPTGSPATTGGRDDLAGPDPAGLLHDLPGLNRPRFSAAVMRAAARV